MIVGDVHPQHALRIGNTDTYETSWSKYTQRFPEQPRAFLEAQMLEEVLTADRGCGVIGKRQGVLYIEPDICQFAQVNVDPPRLDLGSATKVNPTWQRN
jgi:hypothetical protein